jgi:hypothetical protein
MYPIQCNGLAIFMIGLAILMIGLAILIIGLAILAPNQVSTESSFTTFVWYSGMMFHLNEFISFG